MLLHNISPPALTRDRATLFRETTYEAGETLGSVYTVVSSMVISSLECSVQCGRTWLFEILAAKVLSLFYLFSISNIFIFILFWC